MRRHVVRSLQAPQTPGASQAVSVELTRLTFVSGQLPTDTSGHTVGASTSRQAQQVLENLRHVLASTGLTVDALEHLTVYLVDLADLPAFDLVVLPAFLRPPPARSVVQVCALPGGARVMVSAIAGG